MNKLITTLNSNQELSAVRDVVKFLGEYIDEHLSYEEEYMEKINFPSLEEHKKIHAKFIGFMDNIKEEVDNLDPKSGVLSTDLKNLGEKAKKFLGDWLINHILTMDQEYANFAKKLP
ncbi:hemerythrin family protein [archaeon]|nr:hemerythrin family protein [archaeon]MBT4397097.1 hemerythrin family protein [archaeon]MBT4441176.1 hemerythrin family protein [archaeon]